MPPEEILSIVRSQPFRPFRMYVTDGSSYEVRHPEMVLPTKRVVVLGLPGDPAEPFDRTVTVALIHIIRLEPLEASNVPGNGQ